MGKNLYKKLKEKFDCIVILSLSSREDRRIMLEKQLESFGIPKPGSEEFIRYNYATGFPYNNLIASAFVQSGKGRFTKPNEYDCARNHYNIVKSSLELGYEHVLILEDDILFMKDEEKIIKYLDEMPDDYDVIQFGGFTADSAWNHYKSSSDELWLKHREVGIWNCSMYALSRRGMQFYIAFMDKIFCVADMPVYKAPLNDKIIQTYISREPVVIQADKDEVASDIRNADNDKIDYKTQNVYEHGINLNDYYGN